MPSGVNADGTPPKGRTKSSARGAAAVHLRHCGASFTDISETLGLQSTNAARLLVENELSAHMDDGEDVRRELRADVSSRLQGLATAMWPKATDPDHPEHIQAARTAVSILDRFARLHGLDAPQEFRISPTETELTRWVEMVTAAAVVSLPEADVVDVG